MHAATIMGVSAVSKKSTIMWKAFVFLGAAHETEKPQDPRECDEPGTNRDPGPRENDGPHP